MTDTDEADASKRHVVIFGGTGFLGTELRSRLVARGDRVTVVARDPSRDYHGWTRAYWDAETLGPWVDVLEDADVVVHMAGKRVDCRPNRRNIAELIRSREGTVALVGQALRRMNHRPAAWDSALVARTIRRLRRRCHRRDNTSSRNRASPDGRGVSALGGRIP